MCRLYSLMFFDVVMSKPRVPNEDFVFELRKRMAIAVKELLYLLLKY